MIDRDEDVIDDPEKKKRRSSLDRERRYNSDQRSEQSLDSYIRRTYDSGRVIKKELPE